MYAHALTGFATQIVDKDDPEIEKLFNEFSLYQDSESPNLMSWIAGFIVGLLFTLISVSIASSIL